MRLPAVPITEAAPAAAVYHRRLTHLSLLRDAYFTTTTLLVSTIVLAEVVPPFPTSLTFRRAHCLPSYWLLWGLAVPFHVYKALPPWHSWLIHTGGHLTQTGKIFFFLTGITKLKKLWGLFFLCIVWCLATSWPLPTRHQQRSLLSHLLPVCWCHHQSCNQIFPNALLLGVGDSHRGQNHLETSAIKSVVCGLVGTVSPENNLEIIGPHLRTTESKSGGGVQVYGIFTRFAMPLMLLTHSSCTVTILVEVISALLPVEMDSS